MGKADFVAALDLLAEQHMYGAEYVRALLSEPVAASGSPSEQTGGDLALPAPAQWEVERDLGQYEQYVANRDWVEAVAGELSYGEFFEQLLTELKRAVLLRFFDSSFVTNASSLVLIGPSGLGKTHLAIALGTKMVQLGYRVRFVMAQQLANAVVSATTRAEILRVIEPLISCDLLILDEFGYLQVDPQVGPVLYEIIAARYEKGATVITSNKSLSNWGELVSDSALMMAIIDRLLHHGEVFYLRGSSYRMRGKEPVA